MSTIGNSSNNTSLRYSCSSNDIKNDVCNQTEKNGKFSTKENRQSSPTSTASSASFLSSPSNNIKINRSDSPIAYSLNSSYSSTTESMPIMQSESPCMMSSPSQLSSSPDSTSYMPCERNCGYPMGQLSHSYSNCESGFFDYSFTDDNDAKKKANRFFPSNAVDILKNWFYNNLDYPYPDEITTNMLAKKASISTKQVRKWFANKRVRSNKCYKQIYRSKKKSTCENNDADSDSDMCNHSEDKSEDSPSPYEPSSPVFECANIPKSMSVPNMHNMAANPQVHQLMANLPLWMNTIAAQQQAADLQKESSAFYNQQQNKVALAQTAAALCNPFLFFNYLQMANQDALINHLQQQQQQQAAALARDNEITNARSTNAQRVAAKRDDDMLSSPIKKTPTKPRQMKKSPSIKIERDYQSEIATLNESFPNLSNISTSSPVSSSSTSSSSITTSPCQDYSSRRLSGVSMHTDSSVGAHETPVRPEHASNKQTRKVNFSDISELIN